MSIVKTNKFQTLDGMTYNVPIQVVSSSLGTNYGTTTNDQTNNNVSWGISTTTTTWTDTSNLQLTITPKFSNSIIKLDLSIMLYNAANNSAGIRIRRGTTLVWRPSFDGTGPFSTGYTGAGVLWQTFNVTTFDSPSTTSPVTYTLQYRNYTNAAACIYFSNPTAGVYATSNYLIATEFAQ